MSAGRVAWRRRGGTARTPKLQEAASSSCGHYDERYRTLEHSTQLEVDCQTARMLIGLPRMRVRLPWMPRAFAPDGPSVCPGSCASVCPGWRRAFAPDARAFAPDVRAFASDERPFASDARAFALNASVSIEKLRIGMIKRRARRRLRVFIGGQASVTKAAR